MMNAKPILFSGDMIRAILDGRKTQTRRIANMLVGRGRGAITEFGPSDTRGYNWHFRDKRMRWHDITTDQLFAACPYGQPGDLLWVRETWAIYNQGFDTSEESGFEIYRADEDRPTPKQWRPSIFMPRWASRITLKITDVRVQRVQEISDADALSEGIEAEGFEPAYKYKFCLFHSQELFVDLWDSINGKRGFGWNTNPWVWALTFEVIRENVDAVLSKAA